MRSRVEVFHGANLDMLGNRPSEHYGSFTLPELEVMIGDFARALDIEVSFFQTNSEGTFIERLHRAPELADGLILNPGAWTHYSWAIRDALEIAQLPAVEVHISDISRREQWRQESVLTELCIATVAGKGPDGYREALEILKQHLASNAVKG